jgi:chromosome segregation ATPase
MCIDICKYKCKYVYTYTYFHQLLGSNGSIHVKANHSDPGSDFEQYKEQILEQEEKLQQAAEFITYQEEQIQTLTNDMEEIQASSSLNSSNKKHKEDLDHLQQELKQQVANADAYQTQLKDGAKYVETLQDQIDEAGEEISKLRETIEKEASGRKNSDAEEELNNLRLELVARDKKVEQASEFVAFQKSQIDNLTANSRDQELLAQIQDCDDR